MELAVIVQFNGDKMLREHSYLDQASVPVQLGLIEPRGLPVVGGEGARSVLDLGIPLNQFFSVGTPADGTEVFMGALGSRISMCSNFLKSTG